MTDALAALRAELTEWLETGRQAGWFEPADAERIARIETGRPAALFDAPEARPMVVALFGGTGVGKSSLLNRLAGAKVARVGVERPTSREITLYVHEDVRLAQWPPELPREAIRVQPHAQATHRHIAWIDAPDIDSAVEENRRHALAWLPFVDLLVYVVSPERYRDDVGWRVLRERGGRHGWLFVINRWDEGQPQQAEDFRRILREAGFADPVVLVTSCAEPRLPLLASDEFDQLARLVHEVQVQHGAAELERLGLRAQAAELRACVEAATARLGNEPAWEQAQATLTAAWSAASARITEGAGWTIATIAGRFAARRGNLRRLAARGVAALGSGGASAADPAPRPPELPDPAEVQYLLGALWDDWSTSKARDCVDALELALRRAGVAAGPTVQRLSAALEDLPALTLDAVAERVRLDLAQPGQRLRRWLRRGTGFLMTALPGAALAWVAYELIDGYYRATTGRAEFLGTPFAIHSGLLVAVAWALPFVADRLLLPAMERVVAAALRSGLRDGLTAAGERLVGVIEELWAEARQWRATAETCGTRLAQIERTAPPPSELLRRVLRSGAIAPGAVAPGAYPASAMSGGRAGA